MRAFLTLTAGLAITIGAQATMITFNDAYGNPNATVCPNSGPQPYLGCDVVGARRNFDIKSAVVDRTGNDAKITLNYNYGNSTLNQYSLGGQPINVGDFFITDKTGAIKYGIALKTRGAIQAGHLYAVNSAGLTMSTAALIEDGGPGTAGHRTNQVVRMGQAGNTDLATGSVMLGYAGFQHGTDNYLPTANTEMSTMISFVNNTLVNSIFDGHFGIHWAVATCANDVLDGIHMVPEPASFALFGAGALAVAFLRRKK
ncbi:MAG: PEP-CTERM sorting domain-containing protein [Acidobacteria bacterium]|nr:PEP-CTERM sorting domain-containing protein [Acidobacteriota bacterium]